jgi:hypothetical protein
MANATPATMVAAQKLPKRICSPPIPISDFVAPSGFYSRGQKVATNKV